MKKASRIIIIFMSIILLLAVLRITLEHFADNWYKEVQESVELNLWAVPPGEWDLLSSCRSGLFIAGKQNGENVKCCIIDLSGNILHSINSIYFDNETLEPHLRSLTMGLFQLESNGQKSFSYCGVIEIDESLVYQGVFNWDTNKGEALILVSSDYKYGYVNQQEMWIIDLQYSPATGFWNGYAVVEPNKVNDNGYSTVYIIDTAGNQTQAALQKVFFEAQICDVILRMYSYNTMSGERRYYYLDVIENRALLRSPRGLEDAKDFSGGYAAVKVDGLWGYINTKGEFIIEPQYSQALDFSDGFACVTDAKGDVYFINEQNERVSKALKAGYWIGEYHDGLFIWQEDYFTYHLYDMDFKRKLPKAGVKRLEYADCVCIAGSADFVGAGVYLPECGKYIEGDVVPRIYSSAVVVGYNDKYSMYDKHTRELICKYDYMGEFSEGLAFVRNGRRGGFIDIEGNFVIELQYMGSFEFSNGLVLASLETGEIGLLVNPLLYSEWSADENERAAMLGLTVTGKGEAVTYDEMWERI